jgi:3-dehydroquinate dehydratase-2
MNILVLEGPNLNLLGVMSAKTGSRMTLDKVHRQLRREIRNTEHVLKLFQTHKVFQAINFLQRNRNWADGLLLVPMAWTRYEYSIRDTLSLVAIPTIQILLSSEYGSIHKPEDSIFSPVCSRTVTGPPESVFLQALDALIQN